MARSQYLIQIVDRKTGEVIEFEPGLRAEADFIESCVEAILRLGVGFLRSQNHVEQDIRAGIDLAILDLKTQVSIHA